MFSSAHSSFFCLYLNRSFFSPSPILARKSWDSAELLHIKALFHSDGKETRCYSLEKQCRTKWNFENDNFLNCALLHGTRCCGKGCSMTQSFNHKIFFYFFREKGNPNYTHTHPQGPAQPPSATVCMDEQVRTFCKCCLKLEMQG